MIAFVLLLGGRDVKLDSICGDGCFIDFEDFLEEKIGPRDDNGAALPSVHIPFYTIFDGIQLQEVDIAWLLTALGKIDAEQLQDSIDERYLKRFETLKMVGDHASGSDSDDIDNDALWAIELDGECGLGYAGMNDLMQDGEDGADAQLVGVGGCFCEIDDDKRAEYKYPVPDFYDACMLSDQQIERLLQNISFLVQILKAQSRMDSANYGIFKLICDFDPVWQEAEIYALGITMADESDAAVAAYFSGYDRISAGSLRASRSLPSSLTGTPAQYRPTTPMSGADREKILLARSSSGSGDAVAPGPESDDDDNIALGATICGSPTSNS